MSSECRTASSRWAAVGPFAVFAFAALVLGLFVPTVESAGAADSTLVERVESPYNDIYLHKMGNGYFVLTFGARRLHYTESIVNPKDETELPVSYTRSMTVGVVYASGLSDAAMIGLGGGRTSWYLHKSIPGLKMSAAELDPEVVRIAEHYFGVKPQPDFEINTIDGRMYLVRTKQSFDLILVDAYRGPFVPFHLLTREFFSLIKQRLNPGGVVIQNVEPNTMLFDSAVATISSVFKNLDFYKGEGNIVIVGYDGPLKDMAELKRIAKERQEKYHFRYDLSSLLDLRFHPEINWTKQPLTDDFAPVEYLRAIERHNAKQD